jgi:hypothetical protein
VNARANDRYRPIAYVVLALCATFQYIRYWKPWGLDDAWITFRYAANIAHGHGYVYNIGEKVQGTSTPLYTLYLALAGRLLGAGAIPAVSFVSGGVFFVSAIVLLAVWLTTARSPIAGFICAVGLILTERFVMIMTSGMETALYCLLIVATFWALTADRRVMAVLFASLAALTRLDGLALLFIVFATISLTTRRLPLREAAIPIVILGSWGVFCVVYFGQMLPESFMAKQNHTGHALFSSWMIAALIRNWTLAAFFVAGVSLWRGHVKILPMLAWFVSYTAAYCLASLPSYPWYVTPASIAELAVASCGAAAIFDFAPRAKYAPVRWGVAAAAIELAAILFPGGLVLDGHVPQDVGWQQMDEANAARFAAARRAAVTVTARNTVDAPGIGMIGWFTNARIIDPCGLVTPEMVRPFPEPFFTNALAYSVAHYRPDYVFETNAGWPAVITANYTASERTKFGGGGDPFVLWKRSTRPGSNQDAAGPQNRTVRTPSAG